MRYGIFSDVHSNMEALESVVGFYKNENIDRFIFLGDIIGYGAQPRPVTTLLNSLNPLCIAGNHDWGVCDRLNLDYFNEYAKIAIVWTREKLTKEQIQRLYLLPLIYEEADFICVHSSLIEPEQFHYITDKYDAALNLAVLNKRICFIGHSHRQEFYYRKDNEIIYGHEDKVDIYPSRKYIVNVGSVGQPRDKDPRSCCCIYDTEDNTVSFRRIKYDIKAAADKILDAGLPHLLASRLYAGW